MFISQESQNRRNTSKHAIYKNDNQNHKRSRDIRCDETSITIYMRSFVTNRNKIIFVQNKFTLQKKKRSKIDKKEGVMRSLCSISYDQL